MTRAADDCLGIPNRRHCLGRSGHLGTTTHGLHRVAPVRLVHGQQRTGAVEHGPGAVARHPARRDRARDRSAPARRGRRHPGPAPAPERLDRRQQALGRQRLQRTRLVDPERRRPPAGAAPAGGRRRRGRCRGRRPACGRRCPTSTRPRSGTRPGPPARRPSKAWTVTGPAPRSTSIPSRASSCSRRPSTFMADTIGGTCSMSPVERRPRPHRTSARSTPPCRRCRSPRPRRRASTSPRRAPPRRRSASAARSGTQQAGRPPDAEHQHAGGVGVEGAGVAHLAGAEQAAGLGHDVVGGPPGRLVDDGDAVGTVGAGVAPITRRRRRRDLGRICSIRSAWRIDRRRGGTPARACA